MKPALGVTEPGAIAFAASKARSYTKGEIEEVSLETKFKQECIKMPLLVEFLIQIK